MDLKPCRGVRVTARRRASLSGGTPYPWGVTVSLNETSLARTDTASGAHGTPAVSLPGRRCRALRPQARTTVTVTVTVPVGQA